LDLGGLTVHWFDTPGRRETDDPLEAEAIRLSDALIRSADLLIAAGAPDSSTGWPALDREPDLRVLLKADLAPARRPLQPAPDLAVSAATGLHVDTLTAAIRERLVPREHLDHPGPWLFDERLL